MFVYYILDNKIVCHGILLEIEFHNPCKNTRNLDLFTKPHKTNRDNNILFSKTFVLSYKNLMS